MSTFLRISAASRYKDTPAFNEGGVLEYALWEPPTEFTIVRDGYRVHRVVRSEVGFPDLIAVKYYGQGYEMLWWSIMQANAIIDPETELFPGKVLYIPPRTAVIQFMSRTGNAAVQPG